MILSRRFELLVATRNPGKICEIQEALSVSPLKLRYLDEFPNISPVDEIGETYLENALLKAQGYSSQTGVCALADDSGLEVDALGGLPGILSARFAGEHISNRARNDKLLAAMSQHSEKKRTARFICFMALVGRGREEEPLRHDPQLLKSTQGKCEGLIAQASSGSNGFGFDPVFVPHGYNRTFAELPHEVKATISHRALALQEMKEFFDHWLA